MTHDQLVTDSAWELMQEYLKHGIERISQIMDSKKTEFTKEYVRKAARCLQSDQVFGNWAFNYIMSN